MKKEAEAFIKYSIVGASGTFIDLLSLFIFVDFLKVPVLIGTFFSFVLATINNFTLNKFWTFKNTFGKVKHQYIKFMIISCVGLVLTIFTMYVLNYILGLWYMFSKVLTSGIILFWNFFGNKKWTFKSGNFKPTLNSKFKYDFSIIIPMFNEANRIEKTLRSVDSYIKGKKESFEIITVNDGSKDETFKKVSELEISNLKNINLEKNHGKGYAVREGVLSCQGRIIIFMDADNSTHISELDKVKVFLNNYDIVIGSRKLNPEKVTLKQGWFRILISRIGYTLSLSLVDNIRDTQCGFKLFKSPIAKELFKKQRISRFGFDLEILSIAQHYNLKIKEVPIIWANDVNSSFKPWKDVPRSLKDFLTIHYNLIIGRY